VVFVKQNLNAKKRTGSTIASVLHACSLGWWLMVGADLWREKNTVG
jgi:hypothetical protein